MGDRDRTPPLTRRALSHAEGRPIALIEVQDDDEETLRKLGRPGSMGDDERALIGRRPRTPVAGVPVARSTAVLDPDDDTTPVEMFLTEPDEADFEAVRRSRRDSNASVKQVELAAAIRQFKAKIARLKDQERSNNEERADQLLELLNRPPDENIQKLETRVGAVESVIKTIKVILFLVVGGSGGYGLVIAEKIWDRAEREGGSEIRLEHVERQLDDLRKDLRDDLSHRYAPALPSWLQPPQQKERTP